ncbi:response regulator transcription factor [Pigmentiphaga sp.]|uniref:response regulator n=1 Tax=Pigmentiphaga sp. TaxID=1977564 RepID=UPI00128AF5F3|nr:response regulator transcription factor [Pigmentiphaga sp.]MPS28929.1 response regulator transcription factor [Alcaligenaceae bacterium SAGV5]MPS52792.1 response regulator transcription factor [Alcaligenaceae bacterium SAGV3]MPT56894.1 response regulator transcription factor [Alcaligenaceae bacterium]
MTTGPLRILLTEDDGPIRERLARIIGEWPEADLCAACANLEETLIAIGANEIDLLITDINLPDGSGIDAIRFLAKRQPKAEAMVISILADERSVLDAIEAGAAGYLLKDADSIDLLDAIRDVMAGRSPISSRIARVLVRRLAEQGQVASNTENAADKPSLTEREMDILWGIAKGFTYGELADKLAISRQTVPVHIRNIYRKLQATNRSEAVFEASRLGLIKL